MPRAASLDEIERAFAACHAHGFAPPDTEGVPWHEEFPRDVAAAAVCDLAVGHTDARATQPGSTSRKNTQRRGFDLLCTRAVLVKEP